MKWVKVYGVQPCHVTKVKIHFFLTDATEMVNARTNATRVVSTSTENVHKQPSFHHFSLTVEIIVTK